jgi:hypothetical protein
MTIKLFCLLKVTEEGIGSGVVSGSIRVADPDPHQNVTDSQPTALKVPVPGTVRLDQISLTVIPLDRPG